MNKIKKLVWNTYGPYPCLSPGRYESFYTLSDFFIQNKLKNPRVLEIGCGAGIYAIFLDNFFKQGHYIGVDLEFKQNPKTIREKVKSLKIDFKIMNAAKLAFKDGTFDLVLSFWSLEHIKKDTLAMKEAHRVLKKRGIFLVAVPSIFTFLFHLGRHGFRTYRKNEIMKKLRRSGFKINKVVAIGGLAGFLFSFIQNWLDNLVLAPCYIFFKLFYPQKLKGDSHQDIGGGLAKKIVSSTTHSYRKKLVGRKLHFNCLRLCQAIDKYLPVLPVSYLIVGEK